MASFATSTLDKELEQISSAIRSQPLDASHRLALAQLRLLHGEYTKALQQLQLACQFDAGLIPEAHLVRMLIKCEQLREAVFAGKIMPDLLTQSPEWLEVMIKSFKESEQKSAEMRRKALSEAPGSAGSYGESNIFEWISDGDERLGPVIEIMFGDAYYWVPFDKVKKIHVMPPQRVIDLVWTPVELEVDGHSERTVYMPSRYPVVSEEKSNKALLTGIETVWNESSEGVWTGQGRRVWYVDGEPISIFETGHVEFQH